MTDLLFVYGTLMRVAAHDMHRVLARGSAFLGDAHFNGRLYLVAHYPGVVAATAADERVLGEVYRMHNAAELLQVLDEYEACAPNSPQPAEYVRSLCRVTLADETPVESWIYLYNRPVEGLPCIVSGSFLEHMRGCL
jgi:gamma-glutamylcyclotransferase (GGCT)/AIG2-like uncharacterized protein YtfP